MAPNGTVKGIAIGIGVAALAPFVVTSLLGASRPLARAVIKSGLILFEKGREAAAEFAEVAEDLVAEARAEVAQSHHGVEGEAVAGEGADLPAAGGGAVAREGGVS